jgi:lipopolysaccharide/colanic/teichoic acid biosynthesis glycosyltransferase
MSSIVELLVRRRLELAEHPDHLEVEPLARNEGSRFSYESLGKRVFDLVAGLVLLLLFAPAILFIALIVSLDGGKPFIALKRVGQDGRDFRCWKIRTMVLDAEQRLAQILASDPEAAALWARDQKLADDPRVTWLGRSLRATSLDELPQLWNVVRGDMSLVGPRPVTDAEMVRYGEAASHYMSVRPGITGLWQVQGRNDVSYDERVRLDVSYISQLGFVQDISILVRTLGAVLKRTGR